MSSFGFLTRSGERRVSGREYLKLRSLLDDLSWQMLVMAFRPVNQPGIELLRRAVDWPAWVLDDRPGARGHYENFMSRARLSLRTESSRVLVRCPANGPGSANLLELGVNSVCGASSAPIALAARISAQAEGNAWFDGQDRAWLAGVIEEGLAAEYPPELIDPSWDALPVGSRLFSDSAHWKSHYDGWAAAVEMLPPGDGTVVLDYSITDGFPAEKWALWPEAAGGKRFRRWWGDASPEQQWRMSERGLLRFTETSTSTRISPDNLHAPMLGQREAWTWSTLAKAWRENARESGLDAPVAHRA